jgi:hypothetical protein
LLSLLGVREIGSLGGFSESILPISKSPNLPVEKATQVIPMNIHAHVLQDVSYGRGDSIRIAYQIDMDAS